MGWEGFGQLIVVCFVGLLVMLAATVGVAFLFVKSVLYADKRDWLPWQTN